MVSSSKKEKDAKFIKRFTEVCGSDEPVKISNLLGITYQAAKNYLNGRLPDTKTLILIAEKTPYSIHWLLTGEGEKFVNEASISDSEIIADRFKDVINSDFLKAFLQFYEKFNQKIAHTSTDSPKTVILTPDKIREQRVEDKESTDLPIIPS